MDILFLCTGNTCRSPMAAALFSDHLRRAGLEATVHSAGTKREDQPATELDDLAGRLVRLLVPLAGERPPGGH